MAEKFSFSAIFIGCYLMHECDAFCDPEDELHKEYRKAIARAQVASDQAWTQIRNNLDKYSEIRNKIRGFVKEVRAEGGGQASFSLRDWEYIYNALAIVVGETRLRRAHLNSIDSTESP